MAARSWTCRRQSKGIICGHINPKRRLICQSCGKRRAATKRPAHMRVLDETSYEDCVARFGDVCGICGAGPPPGRRLYRDHAHRGSGVMRGLLCYVCNRQLTYRIDDPAWLEKAAAYLRRTLP